MENGVPIPPPSGFPRDHGPSARLAQGHWTARPTNIEEAQYDLEPDQGPLDQVLWALSIGHHPPKRPFGHSQREDTWRSRKAPGELALLPHSEHAALPKGFSSRSKENDSRLSCS